MASEIKLQALKENVDTVEVDAVKVGEGDVVTKDQLLLTVQADKAALDVLSPVAGRVAKVLVKSGDQLKIGQPYVVIEESNGAPAAEKPKEKPKEKTKPSPAPAVVEARKEPPSPPKPVPTKRVEGP